MSQSYCCKVVHITDDGDKLEYTATLEADGHDSAVAATAERLAATVRQLADAGGTPEVDSTKVEMGK